MKETKLTLQFWNFLKNYLNPMKNMKKMSENFIKLKTNQKLPFTKQEIILKINNLLNLLKTHNPKI